MDTFPPGYEWDLNKARTNLAKHGVAFADAATVFDDPAGQTIREFVDSAGVDRYLTVGRAASGLLIESVSSPHDPPRSGNASAMSKTRAGSFTYPDDEDIDVSEIPEFDFSRAVHVDFREWAKRAQGHYHELSDEEDALRTPAEREPGQLLMKALRRVPR